MTSVQDKINAIVDEMFKPEDFAKAMEMQKFVKNTFGITCPACGSDQIYEMDTTGSRSIDETSQIYGYCISCSKRFRIR